MNAPDFAEVLGRHDGWDYGGPGVIECEGCGWKSERLGPEWNGRKEERHRAHVAAAVLAEVRAWLESEGAVDVAKAAAKHGSLDRFASDYIAEDGREWLAGFAARAALAALAEQVGQVAPSRVPGEGS